VPVPTTLQQTPAGDIAIPIRQTTTLEEFVVIACSQTLAFYEGEGLLDTREGVPYFRAVIGQSFSFEGERLLLDTLFRRALSKTPGVGDVRRLDLTFDNATREMFVDAEVVCTNGVVAPVKFILEIV
jgi:hypothetical protein